MSRNVSDHQPEHQLVRTLNQLGREQAAGRSLQPQGSQAIQVGSFTGYQVMDIPDDTILPDAVWISFILENEELTCIASLTRSFFMMYPVSADEVVNADLEEHGLGDDSWDMWLAYDGRDAFGQPMEVDIAPSGTFDTRLVEAMSATASGHHEATVGIRVARLTSDPLPAEVGNLGVMLYEIRILVG